MSKTALASLTSSALLLCACAMPLISASAAEKEVKKESAADAKQAEAVEESLEGARYVAIGSSFAAGPMLPPAKPGAPARCGQSMNNYPTLLAERFGMVLVDRTCSGARTEHVLGPWGDIPPQIEAVSEATRLVTVTIGGNDLNYIGNLFFAACHSQAREAVAKGQAVKPCPAVRVPKEADYFRVERQMNEIARRIRLAAPRARLVFVQYLTPLPPKLCAVTPIAERDAAVVRRIGKRLAEITGRVAQQNRAIVVEMNQSSASHTPCDPEPWMIGWPKDYDGKQGMRWHLNLAGMKATADGIAYWLAKAGMNPATPQQTAPAARTGSSPEAASPQAAPETTPAQTAAAPDIPEVGGPDPAN
ncbi:MAG TPA: SGNH/GDSL hydrolase family protein [Novosphingobium sp.]|nr:SGNH/GDSL hydrolase family protein [Novosphingobium sp.]